MDGQTMVERQTDQAVELEGMIDKLGLTTVLEMAAHICYAKELHLLENWQDKNMARCWRQDGKRLEQVATKVHTW